MGEDANTRYRGKAPRKEIRACSMWVKDVVGLSKAHVRHVVREDVT